MGLFFYSNGSMKNHVKALVAVIISAILLIAVGYSLLNKASKESKSDISVVDRMEQDGVPTIEGMTIDGRKYSFAERKNKLTIVNFWASWCAPCVEEIPSLVSLARHFKEEIDIVALSADEDEKDIQIFLKSFPEMNDQNIFIIQDKNQQYKNQFSVGRLPESFIVKSNGLLEKKVIGTISWYNKDAIEYIQSLIKRNGN